MFNELDGCGTEWVEVGYPHPVKFRVIHYWNDYDWIVDVSIHGQVEDYEPLPRHWVWV